MKEYTKEDIINKCAQCFDNGYGFACIESVVLGYKEYFGIEDDIIPKIATPFGGGIAGNGLTCGALIGAIMCLGMKYGRTDKETDRKILYQKVDNLLKKFQDYYGTLNCGEIRMISPIVYKDPVKLKKIKDCYHENVCNELVENVAEWLAEELEI
ncbi:MAG: C-GCAxxG-C-C family protein [Clostridia bacterium]|nr:C-GCAxxG-C-C family protein [Clostridia bacterium]MDD4048287.1 C-GCAxxG-C-C family protein [Clostridia bacterium]